MGLYDTSLLDKILVWWYYVLERRVKTLASFVSKRKRGKRPPSKKDDMAQIVKQINKEIRDVNDMLKRLYRHGEKNTWASKRLLARLNTVRRAVNPKTKQLRAIDLNRRLTVGEIREYQKSLQAFKESETSTMKGIQEVKNKTLQRIKQSVSKVDEQGKLIMPTDKQTEALYTMFYDKNYQTVTDTLTPSELWRLAMAAHEKNIEPEDFVDFVIKNHGDIEDQDVKDALEAVYKNFIDEFEEESE